MVPPQTIPSDSATSPVRSMSKSRYRPVPMMRTASWITAASLQPPPMEPVTLPNGLTDILAPVPRGVEPLVSTTVTMAFGSWFSARYSSVESSRSESEQERSGAPCSGLRL